MCCWVVLIQIDTNHYAEQALSWRSLICLIRLSLVIGKKPVPWWLSIRQSRTSLQKSDDFHHQFWTQTSNHVPLPKASNDFALTSIWRYEQKHQDIQVPIGYSSPVWILAFKEGLALAWPRLRPLAVWSVPSLQLSWQKAVSLRPLICCIVGSIMPTYRNYNQYKGMSQGFWTLPGWVFLEGFASGSWFFWVFMCRGRSQECLHFFHQPALAWQGSRPRPA